MPSDTPSAEPSENPTYQPTVYPTHIPTSVPSNEPSGQPTSEPSSQPSIHPSSEPSGQPSNEPSARPTSQPSATPSSSPSIKPSKAPSGQPSSNPSFQPSNVPSGIPSSLPTSQPTSQPTFQPISKPSSRPSINPSCKPSEKPSGTPTELPTGQPSVIPTYRPIGQPTGQPSEPPSLRPSAGPTVLPTRQPSSQPSLSPSCQPSSGPSGQPSCLPSNTPSDVPSSLPTTIPSSSPSYIPTIVPSGQPSSAPSSVPSCEPSGCPSGAPSNAPTSSPTGVPSTIPSGQPSNSPSGIPSVCPSKQPSSAPTLCPTGVPSCEPTTNPTAIPSEQPSGVPTGHPSNQPSPQPTSNPSYQPSGMPSGKPSAIPTTPSRQPSDMPSGKPTGCPTWTPSCNPSAYPTTSPSKMPSAAPTGLPSEIPSQSPSSEPTSLPSGEPTAKPTMRPSMGPTAKPSGQPSRKPSNRPSGKTTSEPSGQPSSRPSGEPSNNPTAVFQREVTLNYKANVNGVEMYLFHTLFRSPFEDTVARQISTPRTQLTSDNIIVNDVEEIQSGGAVTAAGRIFYVGVSSAGSRADVDERSLAAAVVLRVSFAVKFPLDEAGYLTPVSAQRDIAKQLALKIQSGQFIETVLELVILQNPGVEVPEVTVSDLEESENGAMVIIRKSSAPTFEPTVTPRSHPHQEFALAYCSGAILFCGLISVILESRWDSGDMLESKSVKPSFSEHPYCIEGARRVVLDALPAFFRDDTTWWKLPNSSALPYHRWLSCIAYLPYRTRNSRSDRLFMLSTLQLLFLYLLLRFGPVESDTASIVYRWWVVAFCGIAGTVGCMIYALSEYWIFVYCDSSGRSMPFAAPSKVRSCGAHITQHEVCDSFDVLDDTKVHASSMMKEVLALHQDVVRYLSSTISKQEFDLTLQAYGLSLEGDIFRDEVILERFGVHLPVDICTPLLVLRDITYSQNISEKAREEFVVSVKQRNANIVHSPQQVSFDIKASITQDLMYELRKLSVYLFYLDILPLQSSILLQNDTKRRHWLFGQIENQGRWWCQGTTYLGLLMVLLYLIAASTTASSTLQLNVVIVFVSWLLLDIIIVSNLSVLIKYKFFPWIMRGDIDTVMCWLFQGLLSKTSKRTQPDISILGEQTHEEANGPSRNDFNASRYFFASHRFIETQKLAYPESKVILSFRTVWPRRFMAPEWSGQTELPAQWMNRFGADGVCAEGSILSTALFSGVDLLCSLPVWIQDAVLDMLLWGIVIGVAFFHLQLYEWGKYFVIIPCCLILLFIIFPVPGGPDVSRTDCAVQNFTGPSSSMTNSKSPQTSERSSSQHKRSSARRAAASSKSISSQFSSFNSRGSVQKGAGALPTYASDMAHLRFHSSNYMTKSSPFLISDSSMESHSRHARPVTAQLLCDEQDATIRRQIKSSARPRASSARKARSMSPTRGKGILEVGSFGVVEQSNNFDMPTTETPPAELSVCTTAELIHCENREGHDVDVISEDIFGNARGQSELLEAELDSHMLKIVKDDDAYVDKLYEDILAGCFFTGSR